MKTVTATMRTITKKTEMEMIDDDDDDENDDGEEENEGKDDTSNDDEENNYDDEEERIEDAESADQEESKEKIRRGVVQKKTTKKTLPLSKEAEASLYINLGDFIAKNHLPFTMADPILTFAKDMTSKYHPKLIERSHTSDTSIARVIKVCMGPILKADIYERMKQQPFSILTDQSSDFYSGKYLALLIRHIDFAAEKPVTKLLAILEIEGSSTSEVLFKKIKDEMPDDKRIRNNFIGFCTDNESKMMASQDNNLTKRLKQEIPHLYHVRDLCHLYNLICEAALEELPLYATQFLKRVCAHFQKDLASNRLEQIQLQAGIAEPLTILRYIDIRWTSLLEASERILNLWTYLVAYFKDANSVLSSKFADSEYHLYTYLTYILLHKLLGYLTYFENAELLYNDVFDKLREVYCLFAKLILKKGFQGLEFDDIYKIKFEDPSDESFRAHIADVTEFKENLYFEVYQTS